MWEFGCPTVPGDRRIGRGTPAAAGPARSGAWHEGPPARGRACSGIAYSIGHKFCGLLGGLCSGAPGRGGGQIGRSPYLGDRRQHAGGDSCKDREARQGAQFGRHLSMFSVLHENKT